MQTTLFKVELKNGRMFRVFCANRSQGQRFFRLVDGIKETITVEILSKGIHTIKQFEDIVKNKKY